ncbi:MAG TPA: amino acid adenylation domain-containing protein, partial [Myxococcales bacterium]|nr:amino acid adenylation domain-containing protein [Myxococcales bacterium]
AERIRPDTLERFAAAFAPAGFRREAFTPSYGLAEATLAVAAGAPGQGALVRTVGTRQLAASGAPLAGTEVRIVEPQTRIVQPAGTAGEIWVRSPSIPQGYWNQPELTAHTFKAELGDGSPGAYLRTGDLGFLQEGQLFVEGRLKDLLIFRGVNHYPEDLEATSSKAHPRLRTGVAFSVEANGEEQLIFVHEVDKPRDDLPAQEIASALRKAVAEEHDLPVQEVVLVPPGALPKTSSGKLQRGLAREKYLAKAFEVVGSSQRSAAGDAAPDLVRATASLFASVLGVTEVGPDEDFFALGGHSLLATQLASRVRETLGFDLPLSAVFEAPTPRALAARLAQCAPADRSPPPPGDRGETLPLSFSQERMWYQHQLEPTGSAYNVAGALHVDGPLDVAAMERSLAAAVARHEALRSNYVSVDGVPRAVVAASKAISFPLADLSSEPDPAAAAAKLVAGFVALPFDLERDLLVRARLYRLGPDRHVMALSLHHVVADGWSLGILLDELLRGYRGQAPAGPAQRYFDYAAWQRQHVGGERLARDLGFWKKALDGAPMLQLPLDRPRPQRRSSKGSFVPLTLSPELMAQLRALARDEGATLSLVMLGALEVLLSRITGQSDVVVGTPVANRNQLASEALVGTLVNTLPLRFQVDADATFAQLLRSLRDTSLAAWAHQDVPFERIVSELQVERSAGQSPLFQVMYDFQNSPMPDRAAGDLRMRPMLYSPGASQFDLSLFILDTELGNAAGVAYSTELFEAQTIERFCAHYLRILEAVAARPKTQVSRIPLLSAGERAALVAQPQANEPPPRELIHRLFEAQVLRTPDAPAVIDAQGTLSYKQLDQLANGLARQLREAGAGPGERVAVFLDRSRRVVVALLATLKTGAAYVPLDPRYPADRVAFLVEDCAPKVLITSEPLRGLLAVPAGVQVVSVQTITPAVAPEVAQPAPPPDSDSPAYLIYTSGSTGRPKGVEVPHFAVANFLKSMAREPGLTAADRVLSVTSISFDIAALEIFLPLVNGASVQVAPGTVTSDGFRLAQLIESSGATVMQATPSTYRLLLEAGWEGRKGLRIFVGGEALARELADKLLARGSELWNLYGPTETTIWSSVHRVAAGQGAVPIGHPIDHTALYILDANGEPVPRGVAGELFIGGAGVANGYFRRPELTAERFVKDPFGPGRMYRTGDAARLRSDGAVEYLGRLDQQVKIRGHRIEPGEIEQVLRENTSIRDASVIAREDRPGEVRLVAYYLVKAPVDQADLRELCRRRLPEHMVPSAFVELSVFPLTPNGKLDRKALPKPPDDLDGPSAANERIPPRDELEAQLAAIWKDVLGRETPGVRDSFFRNGGDSLLAVRLFARIQRRLGLELPLALLAEEPTIEHLAASIRELRSESAKVPAYRYLVPLQTRGHRPKLFCVHGAGGNVLNLPEVARALGPEQPFYGLQASGVDGKTDAQINIEEMATAYLAEVRAVQSQGPYFLAGYCGGGIVAYEMARQVRAAGEKVAALILIDLRSPGSTAPRSRLLDWSRKLSKEDLRAIWRRAQEKIYRDWNNLTGTVRVWWHRYLGKQLPFELRDRWLTDTFLRKADAYKVEPYPGKLVVFRAHEDRSNPAPDLGWGRFAQGGVAAYEVPGDHHTLTHDPNVQVLAAQLAACLRAAANEATTSKA